MCELLAACISQNGFPFALSKPRSIVHECSNVDLQVIIKPLGSTGLISWGAAILVHSASQLGISPGSPVVFGIQSVQLALGGYVNLASIIHIAGNPLIRLGH